jgi:predicted GIY-YIG superfamily endonuclease
MTFWAYMLYTADRTFYVGHTDDLEKRVAQHEQGLVPGYTSTRRPATLVWSESFPTRMEAREAERQIKGWGRAKKLALIRGDWPLISKLAKERQEGPSTSSGKPVSVFLHPHLEHLPSEEFALEVRVRRRNSRLHLGYRLTGPLSQVRLPISAPPLRRDGLWQQTCFEAFVKTGDDAGYREFNLSPSTEWAAYRFISYREGMEPLPLAPPQIRISREELALQLQAEVALPPELALVRLNLTAVIEEISGHKSYWALRHPPSGPPDFHHPDCFALTLPAPGGA